MHYNIIYLVRTLYTPDMHEVSIHTPGAFGSDWQRYIVFLEKIERLCSKIDTLICNKSFEVFHNRLIKHCRASEYLCSNV